MNERENFIAELLKNKGLIEEKKLEKVREYIDENEKSLFQALLDLKIIDEKKYLEVLTEHFNMDMVTLTPEAVSPEVPSLITSETARKYKVIPFQKRDNTILIALSDPLAIDILDNLHYMLNTDVEGVLASEIDITKAIEKYYGISEDAVDTMLHDINEDDITFLEGTTTKEEIKEEDAPIIKLVSLLILEAFKNRASDIHLEPLERKFRVRYRIDGVLQEVQSPPRRLQASVISRIKIMSNMSIAEKRLPQDGRIKLNLMGTELDLRVSSLPSNHGESIVLRLLDKSNLMMGLGQLGFSSKDQAQFERLISLPNGILLITGPTGSGKTTTLYGCLNCINRPDRKIITVEDPVEYQLSGINQVQVNEEIDLTFANVLRSILRQAPNVIMIGEIRDFETAEIAVNASLTGHLVFSTLHTNDAPGAITRLIDQGIKPFLVASSVQGILAQRLVRQICPDCKVSYKPLENEKKFLKIPEKDLKNIKIYRGEGCALCNNTGYKGRIGIFELLFIDDEIRKLIYQKAASTYIRKRAREIGMTTLREDGHQKVLGGITTLEEVFRVTQQDID